MKLRLLFATLTLASAAVGQTLTVSSGTTTLSTGSSSYTLVDVWTTLNQSGGSLNATTGTIGSVGSDGRYTLSGGTASFGDLIIAPARYATLTMAYGTLVVTDGTLTANNLILGDTSSSYLQPRVYQSGGTVTAGSVKIGSGSGNNAAYYLGGGTLATGGIWGSSNSSYRLLHMSGGTIRATASNDNFIYSTLTSMVGGGGVTFDTNGHDIGFHGAFVRDPDDVNLGVVTKSGNGTLTLYGNSTSTGGFRLNGGTLAVYTHDNLGPAAAPLTFNGGMLRVLSTAVADFGARSFNASTFNGGIDVAVTDHTFTIGQALSGSGTFTKAGVGTVVLAGANTLAGGVVSEGTLRITGSFTGNIANHAALVFDRASDLTYGGAVSGTGSLTKEGAGTLILSATSTYTGGTVVNGGTLALTSGGQAGAIRGALTINAGATVESAVNNALGWGSGTRVTSLTINGGTLNHTSAGSHGFAGAYTLNGATMSSNGGAGSATAASHFSIDGTSSFNVIGATASIIAGRMDLRGDGGYTNVNFTVADGATLNVTAGISSHSGSTTPGPVGFTKLGAGTMTLDGANTYTGATAVNAGTLVVNGSSADSAFSVASGATLRGSGRVGSLTLAGTLAPGNSPGTLSVDGNATWNGGATYLWEINDATGAAGSAYDLVSISGSLTLAATAENRFTLSLVSLTAANEAGELAGFDATQNYTYTIASAAGGISGFATGAFAINADRFAHDLAGGLWSLAVDGQNLNLHFTAASPIPEPSTYAALFGVLALGLAVYRRRP